MLLPYKCATQPVLRSILKAGYQNKIVFLCLILKFVILTFSKPHIQVEASFVASG